MSDTRTPPLGEEPLPGTAEAGHHAPGLAFVNMRGEHDLSTAPALLRALEEAAAHSYVLVDLSECSFMDSIALQAIIKTANEVQARGETLVAVIPPEQAQVAGIAHMTRLAELFPIHTSRNAGLAHLEHLMRNEPGA
jgi:anti-anti-sigma factor